MSTSTEPNTSALGASSVLAIPGFPTLLVANVSFFMGFTTFFLLPKYMVTELGATEAQVGWVMASYGGLAIASLPFVGNLSDRLGRRPFLLLGATILGLTCLGFLAVDRVGGLILLLRGLQGLAFSFWFVCSSTLVVDLVEPHRRGSALGLFGISTLVTHGLSPSIAEWVAHTWSYNMVFLMAFAYCLGAWAFASRLDRPSKKNIAHPVGSTRGIGGILKDPGINLLVLPTLLLGFGFGTIMVFSQPHALNRGIQLVSALFIAYSVTSILIRAFFSHVPDLPNKRLVLIPSVIAMGTGVGLLYWVHAIPLFIACGILMGLGHSLSYPTMNALLINRLNTGEHGRGMSIFVGGFNLGMIISQVTLGYLTQVIALENLFLLAGIAVWMSIPLLIWATGPKVTDWSVPHPVDRKKQG
ncbi:MAG: MFS transporter [Pseudomonadota bacterium]|nr:MFS transporter [Pseudomonadota bacterium]